MERLGFEGRCATVYCGIRLWEPWAVYRGIPCVFPWKPRAVYHGVEGRAAGGRQTRGSGWKGGRDFVSSSLLLVVEIAKAGLGLYHSIRFTRN
jgi:hypothetical protein